MNLLDLVVKSKTLEERMPKGRYENVTLRNFEYVENPVDRDGNAVSPYLAVVYAIPTKEDGIIERTDRWGAVPSKNNPDVVIAAQIANALARQIQFGDNLTLGKFLTEIKEKKIPFAIDVDYKTDEIDETKRYCNITIARNEEASQNKAKQTEDVSEELTEKDMPF